MRRRTLMLATLALLALADPAAAAPTASQITAPADAAYVLSDGSAGQVFTATGTTTGAGNVDLDCYDASGAHTTLASDQTPAQLAAGVALHPSQIAGAPCVLRAVPHGDSTARPPGAFDPFHGPRVLVTTASQSAGSFAVQASELGGAINLGPAGSCSIGGSQATDPTSLAASDDLFACAARPAVRVDGADAFSPASSSSATPGWRPLAVSFSENASNGDVTIDETDPYSFCASSCTDAGVVLHRTWTLDRQGRAASETDAWSSTNGSPHTVNAVYDEQVDASAFDFPGTAGFSGYPSGAAVQLPRGTGTLLVAGNGATPAQGALTWASAPDGPATFAASDDVELPYRRAVPASGALTLRFSFAQSFSLAEASALAQAAEAGYRPSIAIASPVDGSTTASASAIVTGTASDALGVASVTVNGDPVVVAADGSWSAPVNFGPGRNTVTAAVTNVDGTTVTRQVSVAYLPPQTLQAMSAPRISGSAVIVDLRCGGSSGPCRDVATLKTRETLRGRRLVRLARRRDVVVGSKRFSIPAGATARVVIPLNATGRRLLRRFGRLPVRLSVGHTLRSGTLTFRRHRRHR